MTDIVDVDKTVSSRISLMRIVLICGIVIVHVPYDPSTSPFLGLNGAFDWLRVFLGDSLFRVGVPCLSAISGYLLFRRGLDAFDYGKTLKTKARTVLTPFLIWNLGFLALAFLAQTRGVGFGYFPDIAGAAPRDLINLGLAAETFPLNLPLYFLRDLLVCILLAPLLAWLVMRFPVLTLSLLFAFAVLPVPGVLFLKKSILLSFTFGIFVRLRGINLQTLDQHAGAISIAFLSVALLLSAGLYQTGPEFPEWLNISRNLLAISGIFGAWALSRILIRTEAGTRLSKAGGFSFWIFCAHYPVLIVLWMIWNRAGFDAYLIFFVLAPVLTVAGLVTAHKVLGRLSPSLLGVLSGSRAAGALPVGIHGKKHGAPAARQRI